MSMVLVIRYNDEELCSSKQMTEWFENKSYSVSETKIEGNGFSFDWTNMKLVNSLMFVIDAENDDDFPPVLFDYIQALNRDDTIVSLAEEGMGNYDLIFEANLPKFIAELTKEVEA